MHKKNIITAGKELTKESKVLIMLHGRGGSAEDILSLSAYLNVKDFTLQNIYFTGFSQGACLTLEFVTRNANKYGGVAAFTGGLIGDKIYNENYEGDFQDTPIFIGTSNPDPHIPVERF